MDYVMVLVQPPHFKLPYLNFSNNKVGTFRNRLVSDIQILSVWEAAFSEG